MKRLEHSCGVTGTALSWLKSYLEMRTQRIAIGSVLSDEIRILYGVPQGSVLGPKLYCIFSRPIGEIFKCHNMCEHCYADGTKFISCSNHLIIGRTYQSDLKDDISKWTYSNMFKLTENKTEFELIVFAPKYQVKDISDLYLNFGGNIVSDAECVKNLGIYFEKTLAMDKQISAVSKSCFNQIRNIERIRPFITEEACKTLQNDLMVQDGPITKTERLSI
ncbi:unnamed protein product [Mytilus coruscus]|uniref:Uncharacterized protein n=1 Tax=Mytilus coruscus TaxID=42192 RepID=A0A6J8E4N7_MYTCO|nr:unnamed protein product [Mytilus coruscus]